jgi:hypothetical protein
MTDQELNQEQLVQEQPQEQQQPVDTQQPKEDNFKELRIQKARAERERDEALRLLKQQQSVPQPIDDEPNLNPDDLVEWKHVQKKMNKLESQLKQYQQQSTVTSIKASLKSQYPDFDSVVSEENIKRLQDSYPEIAQTLNQSQDLYSGGVSAYTLIKKLGITGEEPYNEERDKAQRNASKPRSLASISPQQGDSPLSNANAFQNGLTEELAAQLRKEMAESIRNR